MIPVEFFEWCEATAIGQMVQESVWAFAAIEAVHLLGLCMLGGAVLVVDLRMLGLGMTRQRIPELSGYARPWLLSGIGLMFVTGIPLFLSEAVKCYYTPSFWVKMSTLPFALAFTFLVRERVARADGVETSLWTRLVAITSLGLWFTVAAAGRWIGYSA